MKEQFLHFVWQTLNFDFRNLKTQNGEKVEIVHPGQLNHNQGPDFLDAKIRMGSLELSGAVEIHLKSGDWFAHKHQFDAHYNTVILHVVFISEGLVVQREDGTAIAEISLIGLISEGLQHRYQALSQSLEEIACSRHLPYLEPYPKDAWLSRMGVERLETKTSQLSRRLKSNHKDWEQILLEELASAFGGPVNGPAFREIVKAAGNNLLRKYNHSTFHLEAILLGLAGFLQEQHGFDNYYQNLRSEWQFLAAKYNLKPVFERLRNSRMRPVSFPLQRLAQLAAVIAQFRVLSEFMLAEKFEFFEKANLSPSPYWQKHSSFGKPAKYTFSGPGKELKMRIIINTFIPLAMLYARAHGRMEAAQTAFDYLENFLPENNRTVRQYKALGITAQNSLQSQGLLHLKRAYCDPKNCLSCGIGQLIIGSGKGVSGNRGMDRVEEPLPGFIPPDFSGICA